MCYRRMICLLAVVVTLSIGFVSAESKFPQLEDPKVQEFIRETLERETGENKTTNYLSENAQLYYWKLFKTMQLDYEYELLANEARPAGRKRLGSKPVQVAWIRSFNLDVKEFLFLDKETQQELVEKVPSFEEFGDPAFVESEGKRVFCLGDSGAEESIEKQ